MKCIKKNYWKLAAINFNHICVSSTYLCTYLSNLYAYIYLKHREKKRKEHCNLFLKICWFNRDTATNDLCTVSFTDSDVDSLSYNSALYYVRIVCFVIARKICIISSF